MWQEELVERLEATPHKERSTVIRAYETLTGKCPQQLYRIAKKYGFKTDRTPRIDKGSRKSGITEGQIKFVGGLIHTTKREVKGTIMSVRRGLEIAFDSGIIEAGQVSPSGMRQMLREHQINKAAINVDEPYTHLRSLHPNHCHVFDVSVCIQYYLKGKKGLGIMDERNFYKNKLHNYAKIKNRLLRYVIVDHFSGAFFFRYFNTTGETQNNLYEFLVEAWRGKNDPRLPFRGVPFHLLMDNGAANGARAVVSFLKRLEVNIPEGMPYNSRRQGAVERTHGIIEADFESGLRLQPADDLETLNAWALDTCIHLNANRIHSRHGMSRIQCWLLINTSAGQLRELPGDDILLELYSYSDENFTRLVNRDYTISYKSESYNLKHVEKIIPGVSKVRIIIRPYTPEVLNIAFNEIVYEIKPIKTLSAEMGAFPVNSAIIGEEYKSQPESATQRGIKQIENMAYGEERTKDQIPFEGLKVFGHHADKVDLTLIPKRGTPMEIDRAIGDKEIPFMQFLKNLTQRVGAISKEQNARLREVFGESIDKMKAEEVIRQIEEEKEWTPGEITEPPRCEDGYRRKEVEAANQY